MRGIPPLIRTSPTPAYRPRNKLRFITAASLFDGHDASISIIRRLLQRDGVEVIHLGHNRSVAEIVESAVQEDAQAVAVSSYQGGHIEFYRYLVDQLRERGASHVRVFGGGGGVIVPSEIRVLEAYGVTKIYSPDDGRRHGLQGIIRHMLETADFALPPLPAKSDPASILTLGGTLATTENNRDARRSDVGSTHHACGARWCRRGGITSGGDLDERHRRASCRAGRAGGWDHGNGRFREELSNR